LINIVIIFVKNQVSLGEKGMSVKKFSLWGTNHQERAFLVLFSSCIKLYLKPSLSGYIKWCASIHWDIARALQVSLFLLSGFSGRWVQVFTFLQIAQERLDVESWNFYTT